MLTMEQTFIVTGIVVLVTGTGLGLLVAWFLGYFRGEDDTVDPY